MNVQFNMKAKYLIIGGLLVGAFGLYQANKDLDYEFSSVYDGNKHHVLVHTDTNNSRYNEKCADEVSANLLKAKITNQTIEDIENQFSKEGREAKNQYTVKYGETVLALDRTYYYPNICALEKGFGIDGEPKTKGLGLSDIPSTTVILFMFNPSINLFIVLIFYHFIIFSSIFLKKYCLLFSGVIKSY